MRLFFVLLLVLYVRGYRRFLPNRSPILSLSSQTSLSTTSLSSSSSSSTPEYVGQTTLKVVSFNILAPCYYKITNDNGSSSMESDDKDRYMQRNNDICDLLLQTNADVICLQEFWCANNDIKELYRKKFCTPSSSSTTTSSTSTTTSSSSSSSSSIVYTLKELPRTSHWRSRDDGLAILVNENKVVLQDYRNILFHDCGDRISQLLSLAIKPIDTLGKDSLTTIPHP